MKKCKEKSTGNFFAAKIINAIKEQEKKDILNEIEIMKKLQHKRLIQLYDVYQSKKQICLVLELWVEVNGPRWTCLIKKKKIF